MIQKILSRFNNKHFLALAGNGIVSVFGLLIFGLVWHYLSITDAGKYFFFFTVYSLCDSLRNGFLNTATIKFYAGTEPKRSRTVMGSVWFLAIALTAVVLLLDTGAYYLLPYTQNATVIITVKWVGLTFLSSLPFNVIYWKLQADENYGKLMWLKLVNNSSTLLVFFCLAFTKTMTLERALLFNFLTNCMTSIVGIIWDFAGVRTIVHRSRESIIELVHYGKYSLATNLSANLLGSVDTFIINFMLGPAAVAIYNIPMKLMQIIEIPLQSFVGTGMSGMAVAFNQKNMHQVTYILKKYAGMLTMAFIPLAVIAFFFSDTAIYIAVLGSNKYVGTGAANIFRLYMFFSILYPAERFNGATLDIINRPKVNFYKVLIMLAVNILADFAGVSILHNLYGIATAAFITHLSGLLFGYFRLNKYLPVSVRDIFRTGYEEMKNFLRQQLRLSPKG